MKTGRSLVDMVAHVEELATRRHDVIAGSGALNLQYHRPTENKVVYEMTTQDGHSFRLGKIAEQNVSERLGIGKRYFDRLREKHPDLLAQNVNTLMVREPQDFMLRTYKEPEAYDGDLRAVLSTKYHRMDNYELLSEAILPLITSSEFTDNFMVASCEVTDTKMYLKMIARNVKGEPVPGDVHHAGFVLTNSEVGLGALSLSEFVYRQICSNGMWGESLLRRSHIGRRLVDGDINFSQETKHRESLAMASAVKDMVGQALDADRFRKTMLRLTDATEVPVENPHETIENVTKKLSFSESEGKSLVETFFKNVGRDGSTLYSLANAVTEMANTTEDYDRASELEAAGFTLLTLPRKELKKILVA